MAHVPSHTHDERYYPIERADAQNAALQAAIAAVQVGGGVTAHAQLTGLDYATSGHTGFAPASHNHDALYFTEAEVTSLLAGKSDTSHTHPGLPTAKAVTGTAATTTSTTLATIAALSLTIPANELWTYEVYLHTQCSGVGGLRVGFNATNAPTFRAVVEGQAATATARTSGVATAQGELAVTFNNAALAGFVVIHGYVQAPAAGSTFNIQFKSVTAGQTSTVHIGSHINARKI